MRNIILCLSIVSTLLSSPLEQTATPLTIFSLKESESFEAMNKRGEFILFESEWYRNECFCNYYYSNIDLQKAKICISDIINDELNQLGFEPVSLRYNNSPDYSISLTYPNPLDQYGNVLVTFAHKAEKDIDGNFPRKLGVWQKDRGFRLIEVPKIEYVNLVWSLDETLVVTGREKPNTSRKSVVILSLKEGYFGERKGS